MNPNDVIEAYVLEVMRRLPTHLRKDIGLELRGLLAEMVEERAADTGRIVDTTMALDLVRSFGEPADVALRYAVPGRVIIPAEQTRSFAWIALLGIGLQWALSLPRVFGGQSLAAWWLSWGLGALWWPGLMVMLALLMSGLRQVPALRPSWTPRRADTGLVHRATLLLCLICALIGIGIVVSLPWIGDHLPGVLPKVFAMDQTFLSQRAWPALILWVASLSLMVVLLIQGRWSEVTRRLDITCSLAWLGLLGWWWRSGLIFVSPNTNGGARFAIGLIIGFVALDLVMKLKMHRNRLPASKPVT